MSEQRNREQQVAGILAVVNAHGEWAHGGYPDDVAAEWAEAGFTPQQVEDWFGADVFTAEAAASLRAVGVTPRYAGKISSELDNPATPYRRSFGYKVANGDLSAAQVVSILARREANRVAAAAAATAAGEREAE